MADCEFNISFSVYKNLVYEDKLKQNPKSQIPNPKSEVFYG